MKQTNSYVTDDRQHLIGIAELAMQLQRSTKNGTLLLTRVQKIVMKYKQNKMMLRLLERTLQKTHIN